MSDVLVILAVAIAFCAVIADKTSFAGAAITYATLALVMEHRRRLK